jgi:hypothetical protein
VQVVRLPKLSVHAPHANQAETKAQKAVAILASRPPVKREFHLELW